MDNNLANTNENSNVEKNESGTNGESEAKIKDLEAQIAKLKNAVTNASADASKWKQTAKEKDDELKAKMTNEERTKKEQDEANAALLQRVAELETERNIANYTAALSASDIGMEADTAKTVAEALNAGEIDKVFDGIRKFIVAHDKAIRETALKNNPTLPGGAADKTVTQAEFDAMSLSEMMQFKTDYPELYAQYTKR